MSELEMSLARCKLTAIEIEDQKLNRELTNTSLKDKLSFRFNLKGIADSVFEMIRFPGNLFTINFYIF